MSQENTKRKVNIELLRIISMFLVLLIHYNWPLNGKLNVEMFNESAWKFIGCASLNSLDFVCVNCFIVISGYFGIRWKWKSLLNFLFQISFWGGMIYLVCYAIGICDFNIYVLINQMTSSLWGVNWFFVAYLGLYLLAPILNSFIEKSDERQLGYMVLVFFVFQTLFGWLSKESFDVHDGMSTFSFCGIYLLGAYLRRTSIKIFKMKALANLYVYLGVGVIEVAISVLACKIGFNISIYGYVSPFVLIQTAYLFLFCKSLTINRFDKIILFFSSSAFAALLMHTWQGHDIYYGGLEWIYGNISLPFFASMLWIVVFFISACCLDKTRIFVWNHTILRLLDKYEIK